jgi:hypothetical protein
METGEEIATVAAEVYEVVEKAPEGGAANEKL